MTECERILAEGILPESFLEEETRCDFWVDKRRKKLWAVTLDLLIKFDEVCKKHNIKYFLMFGTLLGAVRHKGFIPWDDDADIAMLREDYEKLLKIADQEFTAPYFFQTPYTDKGAFYSFTKLRNSNTSSVSKAYRYEKFNQGIALDIYPLDNCNMKEGERNYNLIKELNIKNSSYMRRANPHLTDVEQKRVDAISGLDPLATYEKMQSIATQYNKYPTENVICAVVTVYDWTRQIFPREICKDLIDIEFEGYEFPVPRNYDKVLSTLYGDYMQFPPLEERGVYFSIKDADRPYKEYLC